MKVLDQSLLEEITRRLVAEFDPEQIILFGSHAWGQPDDDSDVDLFVIVSESELSPTRRDQEACRCMGNLPVAADILVRTRHEFERFQNVYASLECQTVEQGKVLYDRGKANPGAGLAHKGRKRPSLRADTGR
jgi:hypothetical protein